MRYRLSRIIPVRFHSTYAHEILGVDVQAGGSGNHFRDDDHHDLVSTVWWQWRDRCYRQRTQSICLARLSAVVPSVVKA